MFSKRALKLIIVFSLLIMALFILRLDSLQASPNESGPTPQQAVAQAWEKAQQSNTYTFQTEHFQTTYPAPGIASAGRQPEEDHVALTGAIRIGLIDRHILGHQAIGTNFDGVVADLRS